MTIVSECPLCENRFNLQPRTIGKQMRCPNLSCRHVFTVELAPGSPEPPLILDEEPAETRVVDAQLADEEIVEAKVAKPRPAKPKIIDAEIVEAKVVSPKPTSQTPGPAAGPRVVEWSPSQGDPPAAAPLPVTEDDLDDTPVRRRRRKTSRSKLVIGVLVALILAGVGSGAYFIIGMNTLSESRLAKQADDALKAGDFPAAARGYRQLLEEFPGSSNEGRYRFHADLAGMRAVVQSVTSREDPFPARDKFQAFVAEHGSSEFAKPGSGLGSDIAAAGAKVSEDLSAFAADKLGKYRADRAQAAELERAEETSRDGRRILGILTPFQDPEVPLPRSLIAGFDKLDQEIKNERDRAAFFAGLRERLQQPSDATIADAENDLARRGYRGEADMQKVLQDARIALRNQVRYVASPAPPRAAPMVVGSSLLFASPLGRPASPIPQVGEIPGTFLAQTRGILYALDERTGTRLWAERIGIDRADPPTRHRPDDDSGEIALVLSEVANEPGLTARRVRTGEALWHQPLSARAAGPAVVVARRIYVPLRDERGTIVEFDLASGARLGSISLGQPLGPGAVHRAGTGLLYIAAEVRRVFVLDVDARNDDGIRQEPRLVQVYSTGHVAGTLRVPPLILGPEGRGPEPRWLIFAQTEGPRQTKLRAFKLEDDANDTTTPERALPVAAEVPLPGWPWFPLVTDGERIAIATDAGSFHLVGVQQPGAQDRPLFLIAQSPPDSSALVEPRPAVVVAHGDDVDWVLAQGVLRQWNLSFDSARGLTLVAPLTPTPLGTPLQPVSLNATRDVALIVVRDGGPNAMAWDLTKKEKLWSCPLGLVPAIEPMALDSGVLLADEAGGLTLIPREALDARTPGHRSANPAWRLASPLRDATGPTQILTGADSRTIWAVTPLGTALSIRRVQGRALTLDVKVNSPAALAGAPLASARQLLLPLADGFVYRLDEKSWSLHPGPGWRPKRSIAESPCYLVNVKDDDFLATDGQREIHHWRWPADGSDWKRLGGKIVTREVIAIPPRHVPGAGVLAVDRTGSVWLYDLANAEVIHRWRSGGTSPIPLGRPTSPFIESPTGQLALTIEGRSLVVLDPRTKEEARVVSIPADPVGVTCVGPPMLTTDGNWLLTDGLGRVHEFAKDSLAPLAVRSSGPAGTSPAVAMKPLDNVGLASLTDGSLSLIPLSEPKRALEAPMPRAAVPAANTSP